MKKNLVDLINPKSREEQLSDVLKELSLLLGVVDSTVGIAVLTGVEVATSMASTLAGPIIVDITVDYKLYVSPKGA